MAAPWEKFRDANQLGPWQKYGSKPAAAPAGEQPYSGAILPFTRDAQGNVSFDPNAGLLGAVKRVVEFPAEAVRGNIDPLSDEGIARAAETATMFSPVSAGARGGLGWAGAKVGQPRPPPVPTREALKAEGKFGYALANEMGVDYDGEAVRQVIAGLQDDLYKEGYRASGAPEAFAILSDLANPPPGAIASLADIDAARQALGKAAQNFNNPREQAVAAKAIAALDRFTQQPDPAAVVAGPAAAAGIVQRDARGNIAAQKRSQRLFDLEENAERRAATNNSGRNIGNTIRARAASILESPKKRSGFSPEEIALIETVARGTATRNTLRFIGNLLGGGGGLAAMLTGFGGATVSGSTAPAIVGTGLVSAGVGAKALENYLTKRALGKADTAVRKRSPLYQNTPKLPGETPVNPEARALAGRAAVAEALASSPPPTGGFSPVNPAMEEIVRALQPLDPAALDAYIVQKYAPTKAY